MVGLKTFYFLSRYVTVGRRYVTVGRRYVTVGRRYLDAGMSPLDAGIRLLVWTPLDATTSL